MTYFKNEKEAKHCGFKMIHDPDYCFLCGDELDGPTVEHQGFLFTGTMLMHRDCAFAMANRIITDCWRNRREGELMRCDR